MQTHRSQGRSWPLAARLLAVLTAVVGRHPWWTLGLASLAVLISLAYTHSRLGFKTDRGDLLSAES